MSKAYAFPLKLKLIIDHLDAIRTLDEYVNGVGLKKDMQGLSNHLQRELSLNVLQPAGWQELYRKEGNLYSSPKCPDNALEPTKWCVAEDDFIAIEICPFSPLHDDDFPCAGLYVPPSWNKRQAFLEQIEPPPGFEHVRQYSEGELSEESSVWKYVPYTSHVSADGRFDATGFLEAFREATQALVAMEKEIDQIVERLG